MKMDKLSKNGRCMKCGRFIKRGLYNYILHYDICPERIILIFSLDHKKCKLTKLKNIMK